MLRIQILLITLLCLASLKSYGQRTVTGKVTNVSGEALAGVTILEEGTTNGTVTTVDGDYSISVKNEQATLRFSYIGYKAVSKLVGNASTLNISMEEDSELMEEVVVTALGLKSNKDQLGYANSQVEGEKLVNAGEPTLSNSLSGKISGVRVNRNSSDPGAGSYVQIRGVTTITRDNQPLIVVDGIPISNESRGNSESGGVNQESRLNDINPNDIESISVLKGAAAAALYGTQAYSGVILITTKSGEFNSKLKVTFRSTFSLDEINRKYPLQTKFGQGDNGIFDPRARDSWGDRIADRSGGPDEFDTSGEFFVDQDGNVYYPITNKNSQTIYDDSNFDQIFQNGYFWENNISLSGGTKNTSVRFSVGDIDQEGIIRNNSDYRRTTIRLNLDHVFTEDIQLKTTASYSRTNSNRIQKGANSSGLYLGLLRTPPDFDNTGYRGDYFAGPDASPIPNRHRSYREPLGADGTPTYNNPNWTINEQENEAKVNRFISSFELTVSPLEWLDLIGRVGLDYFAEQRNEFFTPGSASGAFRTGRYEQSVATNTIFNMDYIARATRQITDNFGGTLLVGFNYRSRTRAINGVTTTNFIQFVDVDDGVRDVDNALPENTESTSATFEERSNGFYSSLDLTFWDMLYLTGTIRVETASTFGESPDNVFAFPSVSLAWQFTQLGNLKSNVFSFGKLRLSYGEVGVQPGPYNTSNVFVSPSFGDQFGGDLNLSLYGNGGFVPSAERGNSSLNPERKKEFEIGTDLRFLNDRITFSATYFNNRTEDVLLDFPVANSRGYSRVYTNGAELENQGLELDLGFTVLKKENFSWNILSNYTRIRNEIIDLRGAESLGGAGLAAVDGRVVEGEPFGVLWGSRTLRDDEGNIVFDENGFPRQDELEGVIGDPNPDWQGAITSIFTYKNVSLSVLLETFQGADIYAGTKSVLFDLGRWESSANEVTATRNLVEFNGNIINIGETFRGTVADFGAGPVALTESWYNGLGGFFGNGNDELYIEDGSWTRLRELSISYTVNSDWLKNNLGVSNLQLTATGRNLIIWTNFEGNDPDTSLSGVSAFRGIDYFNNPGTRSYLFSLLVSF